MNDIDKLIADLKQEYQTEKSAKSDLGKPDLQTPSQPTQPKQVKPIATSSSSDTGIDSLVADLKQEYQQQDRQVEKAKQEQAQLKQQRKQDALQESAKQWLQNLDPHSDEGLWFEEFSYAYESKLAAAIDYLSAMKEVKHNQNRS